MELNIEDIIAEISTIPNKLNLDHNSFKDLEEKFESNYDKLSSSISKSVLLDSIGTLATLKLFQGLKVKDEEKVTALKEFRNYLNKSDKLEINQKRSFALKGFYYFFQGDFKQSVKYFDNARDIDPYYLPHMLGRGLVEYQRKDYKLALGYFKQVFQLYRHIMPKAAYIMGLCYLSLSKLELADKCFNYMNKYNLGNQTENHIAIAIVRHRSNDADGYYYHLIEAFKNSPGINDINTCLNLAEHYFFKKDFDKATKLTKLGIRQADNLMGEYKGFEKSGRNDYYELRSRLSYMLGFIEHSTKSPEGLTEAYKHYKSALQSNPFNYSAQFGLAQILYYQRNYAEANECLETILNKLPEHLCRDCYTVIPHVYMRLNKEQKAYEAFDKVMKYFPNNTNVLVDYVSYLEVSDPKKSLDIYEKILECADKDRIEPEILNNMAVAFIQNKNFAKALSILERAKVDLESQNNDPNKIKALGIIVDYNRARIFQKQDLLFQAAKIYQTIVAQNPLFYECYLHLAKIYALQGDNIAFAETINTAMYICYKTLSASKIEFPFYLQIAQLIKLQSFNEALDYMSKIKRQDTFLLLYRASILYNFVVYNRSNINEAKKYIKHAAEICSMILRNKEETNNIYAANIVACLLAERGRVNDSLTIFRSFQDILDNNSPLLYNLAVAEYIAGNAEKAVIILESPKLYYKLRYNSLYALLNVLLEKYTQAEKVLKYRYIREPSLAGLYNYVACLHKRVKDLFTKKEARINDVELLNDSLKYCERVFDFINNSISPKVATALNGAIDKAEIERRSFYDLKRYCEKQLFYLQQNQDNYHKMMDKELEKRKQMKMSLEQRKQQMEIEKNKVIQKVEEKQKEELSKEELMELRAKEAMEMAKSLMADIKVQQAEIRQPVKRTKKEKVKSDSDGEDKELMKENKIPKIGKKIKKDKAKLKHERSNRDESDVDSFIAGDITDSDEVDDEKPYEEGDFSDESANNAIYDPLHNYKNDTTKTKALAEAEPKRLTRKSQPITKKPHYESESEPDEPFNPNESPSISESPEKQPEVKDVNEDIYISKHRPNKKLLIDDYDEDE